MKEFAYLLCFIAGIQFVLCFEDKTVYQYLVDNGFRSFQRLLEESKFESLLNGPGPFTVLAPTNAAISKVDPTLMVSLGHNRIQLQSVVKYHILDGFQLLPQLMSKSNVTTKEGQKISITTSGTTVVLNNASNIASGSDVICNNGIIHPIDTLLLPPVFGMDNIAQILITQDYRFKDLFMFFYLTNMTHILQTGEYTVFAPVDAAWAKFSEKITHPGNVTDLAHIYIEMMKYQVIPGARTASMLQDGQQLYTLHGYPINVTVNAQGITVDTAHVIDADIPASNGVIHAVDNLLFPHDLFLQLLHEYQTNPHRWK